MLSELGDKYCSVTRGERARAALCVLAKARQLVRAPKWNLPRVAGSVVRLLQDAAYAAHVVPHGHDLETGPLLAAWYARSYLSAVLPAPVDVWGCWSYTRQPEVRLALMRAAQCARGDLGLP